MIPDGTAPESSTQRELVAVLRLPRPEASYAWQSLPGRSLPSWSDKDGDLDLPFGLGLQHTADLKHCFTVAPDVAPVSSPTSPVRRASCRCRRIQPRSPASRAAPGAASAPVHLCVR